MAILKCKMCGGDIQATDNTYGTCDSCGSTMTLPKASDEQKVNLFNRANNLRRQNEFDKAVTAFENILNIDASSAEAHWGLVLSKYGIEYVEDPISHERVPTCHRVQSESILTDADYLSALDNAEDEYTRSLYEEEAKKISEIQKGILAISSGEEPYDVFICYKETTEGGSRTKDSALAQDLYYQLVKEGYKVFFSRISLEKKLGQQYEPYIFSALNSAKVMLVIGTKPEYFNAVWVKNEWSRFLALMKKDHTKLLIPCYRDMDAFDLPEELVMLQSQDMGRIGFAQDILHGVKKVVDSTKESSAQTPTAAAGGAVIAPGVESLTTRGKLFLEDSDWQQADEYFDKALDIDPKYAPAYIGKLCAELHFTGEEQISDSVKNLSDYGNYKKAIRFADTEYRIKLEEYYEEQKRRIEEQEQREREEIKARNDKLLAELGKLRPIYVLQKQEGAIRAEAARKRREWQNSVNKILAQSRLWNSQWLCQHCGGQLSAISTKCKSCKKTDNEPVQLPELPVQYPMPEITVNLGNCDWMVLDVHSDTALLLSEKIVEYMPYSAGRDNVTWESCSLREYLNNDFLDRFNDMEKKLIVKTKLENSDNQQYGTDGGNATYDKVFLLSLEEVIQYFGDSGELMSIKSVRYVTDQYDSKRIAYDTKGVASMWWLRSPAGGSNYASCITGEGYIYVGNNIDTTSNTTSTGGIHSFLWLENVSGYANVDKFTDTTNIEDTANHVSSVIGVRPALWLNLQELSQIM